MIGGFPVRALVSTSPVTKPPHRGLLEALSADFGPTRTLGEPSIQVIEPTADQIAELNNVKGRVALAQFIVIKDNDAFNHYLSMSNQAVISNGGHRSHNIHIDQYYSGGVMSYQSIVIDVFPSGQNAQRAFLSCKVERESGLLDMYSMIVRPTRNPLFIVKASGFLSPILSRWLGTNVMSDMPATTHGQSPEKWPTPETITKFKSHDRTVPFCNMNLNKYYSTEGDTSGNMALLKFVWVRNRLKELPGAHDAVVL